jgi:hypothetical protein
MVARDYRAFGRPLLLPVLGDLTMRNAARDFSGPLSATGIRPALLRRRIQSVCF